jgi:ubiquinone biosynthesis protein COQ9
MRARPSDPFSFQPATQDIRDSIVEAVLPEVPFDGWTWEAVENAAVKAGYEKAMAQSVFAGGLPDVLDHFADLADRWMLERLSDIDPETLRVRDRVKTAVLMRFRALYQYRDATRQSNSFWIVPTRARRAGKITWRTADRIWNWAGDTATDYNHYTKRALLCSVLVSTALAWVNDDSAGIVDTEGFLDRRIEGVMTVGKVVGKAKGFSFLKKNRKHND